MLDRSNSASVFLQLLLGTPACRDVPVQSLDANRLPLVVMHRRFQNFHVQLFAANVMPFDIVKYLTRLDHAAVVGIVFLCLLLGKHVEHGLAEQFVEGAAQILQVRRVAEGQMPLKIDPIHTNGQGLDKRMIERFGILQSEL